MKDLRVSILQCDLVWEDREANLQNIETKIQEFKGKTDLIILPEMFTTGFSMKSKDLAENFQESASLKWMQQKAEQLDCLLVGSLIMEDKGEYFNRLLAVKPDGTFSHYDKRHLFRMGNEHEHFSAGTSRLIVEYKGWRICPLVCYDLRFPVWSRNNKDFDLMIYIANWPDSRSDVFKTLLKARALENQVYVAGVNRVGKDGMGLAYSGDSCLISAKGEKLLECEAYKEALETITISGTDLEDFRKKFPVHMDADRFQINL